MRKQGPFDGRYNTRTVPSKKVIKEITNTKTIINRPYYF